MGVLLLLQSLSNQFCALLCGGLGCSPPTAALLKCRAPKISFLGVTQEEEEKENRGLHPGLGLSHHKALALLFLLPEWTLHVLDWCTVVGGPGFLVGSW